MLLWDRDVGVGNENLRLDVTGNRTRSIPGGNMESKYPETSTITDRGTDLTFEVFSSLKTDKTRGEKGFVDQVSINKLFIYR